MAVYTPLVRRPSGRPKLLSVRVPAAVPGYDHEPSQCGYGGREAAAGAHTGALLRQDLEERR